MRPATLLDVFAPPVGMVGHSAALVAMTGTEDFLEEALERFTKLRPRRRAELGQVFVYLMLDGHASASRQQVFRPGQIAGLHELHPRAVDAGSLLHAKVALLAFAPTRTGAPAHLRLAVLTANLTRESACHQLELVWTVDVSLDGSARAEDRADIAAAGAFIEKLLENRFHRDEHELPRAERKLTARLDTLLSKASELAPANRKPRFMHSLERPLYEQIRERIRSRIDSPRNLLLCGSGFYERPLGEARKPEVFGKLEDLGVFTASVRRIALVEPQEAGAPAIWARGGETEGWELVQPVDALGKNRRLHAKFLYAGYLRGGHLSNGWMYLGSGNLSKRGLLSSDDRPLADGTWNVETGVVFDLPGRLDAESAAASLFWSIGGETRLDPESLEVGQVGDEPSGESLLEAPPVLSAAVEHPQRLRLHWRDDVPSNGCVWLAWTGRDWFDVRPGDDVSLNEDESPTVLHVRTDDDSKWVVPVVDASGRVGWAPPRFDTYADALAALLDFPTRPADITDDDHDDDDDDGDDGGDGGDVASGTGVGEGSEQEKSYALHAAAELVEKVAALQAELPATMVDDWLDHLDRMLRGSFPEPLIATWRAHGLDVFVHLRDFPPRELTGAQRRRYFKLLADAAKRWGLR